jgi:CRISPR/Cas system CMR subunit Cmr4 (Cas7 group RAMP superfamily)
MNEPKRYKRYKDARSVAKRLQVRCVLEMTSPAHIGGEMSLSLFDQPIRVNQAGRPYLPGTTMAGLLRHHMHALFTQPEGSANEDKESDELAKLFGAR